MTNPFRTDLSGFLHDPAHLNAELMTGNFDPLMQRNPLLMRKAMPLLLLVLNSYLLYLLAS